MRLPARGWIVARIGMLGLCMGAGLAGCGTDQPQPKVDVTPKAAQPSNPVPNQPTYEARLHQPIKTAALFDNPAQEVIQRPPDQLKSGKSVGKLFEAVVGKDAVGGLWDEVKFQSPAGKRLNYTATVKTDQGDVVIELWPDLAPNHVRNFVALAKAGYYDGLEFDRSVREDSISEPGTFLQYIEAGCPLGTGDPALGSIGYWLKPELNPHIRHEEGTVAASHVTEAETAGCKFYVTLTKAPWMDGNYSVFGKVVKGLDVARTISNRPKASDEAADRPREPVVIRQVAIECTEADRAFGPSNEK